MKKKEDERKPSSPDQHMVWALFHIAKRAWYKDQQEIDKVKQQERPEPPAAPVPGQGWFADPSTLQIHIDGTKNTFNEGSSVKIKLDKAEISKAFCPRPFLIVSNERLLEQKRAWVCPCSSRVKPPFPKWVVPLPEFKTYCLISKLHTIDTEFFADIAKRDLLRTVEGPEIPSPLIGNTSMQRVRTAIEQYLAGAFAPTKDQLPPGSIIRYPDGSERVVLANCYLSNFYHGAGALTTTCRINRVTPHKALDRERPLSIVPLPGRVSSTGPATTTLPPSSGFMDLGHVSSENQSRLVPLRTGYDPSILTAVRGTFQNLLLGEGKEKG